MGWSHERSPEEVDSPPRDELAESSAKIAFNNDSQDGILDKHSKASIGMLSKISGEATLAVVEEIAFKKKNADNDDMKFGGNRM